MNKNFFAELKRRNVYRVGIAYVVVAWLLIQIATQVFPFFEIPGWGVRLAILLIALGLPISLIFAWAFELTPEGVKRTAEVAPEESITRGTGRKLDFLIIAVLLLVIALLLLFRDRPGRSPENAAPEKSIAVLPFENRSSEKENAYFADGIQSDILTHLAKVADLKVISSASVMSYRRGAQIEGAAPRNLSEIGRVLGVAHLVEGSVRRERNRVRVTAQLINARDGAQLWSEMYDRDLADVFEIQSDIARAIVSQLRARLSPAEKAALEDQPTKDITAYDLYLQGKEILSGLSFNAQVSGKLWQAIGFLERAVARDPDFLLAYCQLAFAHDHLYFWGLDRTPARAAAAESAIAAALRLRPGSGEGHLARAGYLYRCHLDYDRARTELATARGALPNNAQVLALSAYIDRRQGRWNESTRNLEKALELDPRNSLMLQQLALSYQILRRFAEMRTVLDRTLEVVPSNADTRVTRALVELEWRADPRPLRETIQAVLAVNPAEAKGLADQWLYLALCERDAAAASRALAAIEPGGITTEGMSFPRAWCEAVAARARGDAAAAQAAFTAARLEVERTLQAQPNYAQALCVRGLIDAGLGRKEEAIRAGKRAVELLPVTKDSINGSHMITYLAVIYAWTGEKDLALQQVEEALRLPGYLSYGRLRLHPYWDALRGDARFDDLVASLAPKETSP